MDYVRVPKNDWQDILDATRSKTGGTEKMVSGEVAPAIAGIETGGHIKAFYTPAGRCYLEDMDITGMTAISTASTLNALYQGAVNLKSVKTEGGNISGLQMTLFDGCSALEAATLNNFTAYGHYIFQNCTALKTVQLGSVGFPVTSMGSPYVFRGATQSFDVTIYVDAMTLSDISAGVTNNSPWGATNATIIYRNSTTGEVITE